MSSSLKKYSARKHFTWDRIKMALEAAEEGFYIWDLEEKEIYYTSRCLSMMGANQNEKAPNIFTQADETIHEDDVSFFKQEVTRYLNGHSYAPMRIEVRMKKLNSKSWSWVRVNGLAVRDSHLRPTMLIGVWVNINRRKTAEMRSVEDRELFQTLIEHIPDSIFFKNRESRFVLANTSTARKFGVPSPVDLIGRTDADFFDPTLSNETRDEELKIMQSGQPINADLRHETWLHKEDSWSQISKFPWYSRTGVLKGIVGISSDVTKIKKTEAEARQYAHQLEEKNKALHKEINLAKEIQLALLPYKIPSRQLEKDGKRRQVDFHHIFSPSEGVAGDWFSTFNVGDTGVGALVCDVMGHGIPAALIASMLRGMTGHLSIYAHDPARFITNLNNQLTKILKESNTNLFVSGIYAYLDLESHEVSVCSAGHPFPIFAHADGNVEKLQLPRGMVMGLMEGAPYQNCRFTLESGDRMMLYTDGVTEALNSEGEEMGAEYLIEHLKKTNAPDIKDFIQQALICVAKYSGSDKSHEPQNDDICMLGVSYTESDALAVEALPQD